MRGAICPRDAAELMAYAIEALTLHLESLREDSDAIPAPGELDDPLPAWLADFGEDRFTRTLVPVEIGGAASLAERLAMALPPDQRRRLAQRLAAD